MSLLVGNVGAIWGRCAVSVGAEIVLESAANRENFSIVGVEHIREFLQRLSGVVGSYTPPGDPVNLWVLNPSSRRSNAIRALVLTSHLLASLNIASRSRRVMITVGFSNPHRCRFKPGLPVHLTVAV